MKAFYFGKTNRKTVEDDRDIVVGETHEVTDTPRVHVKGLHGSITPIDALYNGPQHILYLINLTGSVHSNGKRRSGKKRKYLNEFDAGDLLLEFSRKQALININDAIPYCSVSQFDAIETYLNEGQANQLESAYNAAFQLSYSPEWQLHPPENLRSDSLSCAAIQSAIHKDGLYPTQSTNATLSSIVDKDAANLTLTEMIEDATGWNLDFSKNQSLR